MYKKILASTLLSLMITPFSLGAQYQDNDIEHMNTLDSKVSPKVDLVKCDEKELEVKFIFVLEPKVELGKYTNLGGKKEKVKVVKEDE